ncbi:MAG: Gfo/Idh/MocA family oxidoreductase [bacterium]|nr:Gfo/Idh/MocA family oxidoreductase [bacterium]
MVSRTNYTDGKEQNLSKLRIGVIGTGNLGQHHARVCTELPNAELAGVADINEARAREVGGRHKVPFFTDQRELLKQVDAVSIVVPTTGHHQAAMDALAAGKHVLVEKPITATVAQARELTALAEQKLLKLQVGHIERFNPALLAAAAHIHDPRFIECLRISPFGGRNTDVPVVLDLMIHDIDIVLSLVNSELERVSAIGCSLVSDREDIANARLEFKNGCVANLTASRISGKKERKMRFFQKDSYITVDFLNHGVKFHKLKGDPRGVSDLSQVMELIEPQIDKVEQLKAELGSFADCIINDTIPLVSGRDGLRALQVAEEIMGEIEKRNQRLRGKL